MNKAVMISINPKWCKLIASGKKTLEIRKSMPKLQPPFKCYIYCTKGGIGKSFDNSLVIAFNDKNEAVDVTDTIGNGKVIGEFVCDKIYKFNILKLKEHGTLEYFLAFACMSYNCLINYIETQGYVFYGWHISDLKIYDKPKELSEFKKRNRECCYSDLGYAIPNSCKACYHCNLTRPPQSWCYVEEIE